MMKRTTRSLLAGALIAGVAVLGTGGVAVAAQAPGPTSPGTSSANRDDGYCRTWVPRLPSLEARKVADEQKMDDLQAAINVARAHHDDRLVLRLESQLIQVTEAHSELELQIAAIQYRCHV